MTMFNQNNPAMGSFPNSNQGQDMYPNNAYRTPWTNQNGFMMNRPNYQMLPGRVVANIDEITPQEVMMDGSVSIFPQSDFSCIYAKQWAKDGTIQTIRYVPEIPQQAQVQSVPIEEQFNLINQRFDKIEKMLSGTTKRPYKKRPNQYPKKEVTENE